MINPMPFHKNRSIWASFSVLVMVFFIVSCKESKTSHSSEEKIDFFLCIGQSNMAGRAVMQADDTLLMKNVFLFNDKQEWEQAKNPLNRYSTVRKRIGMQQIGPSWTFAQEIVRDGRKIGLVVNARGGTQLTEWKKGSEYYNKAVIRVLQAQKKGNLKGILWHQGEADRKKWKDYAPRFKTFIENLRKDLNTADVPVIVGEIGNWKGTSDSINKTISKLKEHISNIDYIKASNLGHLGDSLHFSRDAQIEMGKRYAKKYLELKYNP